MKRTLGLFFIFILFASNVFAAEQPPNEKNSQKAVNVKVSLASAAVFAAAESVKYGPAIIRTLGGLRVFVQWTGVGCLVTVGTTAAVVKFEDVTHDRPTFLRFINPDLERLDRRIWQGIIYGTQIAFYMVRSNLYRVQEMPTAHYPGRSSQPAIPASTPKRIPIPTNTVGTSNPPIYGPVRNKG